MPASTPIATRRFFKATDPNFVVEGRIYAPFFEATRNSWSCTIEVTNAPADLARMTIGGMDSYQALKLAFFTLGAHINALNERHMNSELRFLDADDPDLRL